MQDESNLSELKKRDWRFMELNVKELLNDERLNMCSASTCGVYLKGIRPLMYKRDDYGTIKIKSRYKKGKKMEGWFGQQLCRVLPFSAEEITEAIEELTVEGVLSIDKDLLINRGMIEEYESYLRRSEAGKKGGRPSSVRGPDKYDPKRHDSYGFPGQAALWLEGRFKYNHSIDAESKYLNFIAKKLYNAGFYSVADSMKEFIRVIENASKDKWIKKNRWSIKCFHDDWEKLSNMESKKKKTFKELMAEKRAAK